MRATFVSDVYHAVLSMLLAECRRRPTLDIKGRLLRACVIGATLADNVHHVVVSVLFAVQGRPTALDVKRWVRCA